MSSITQAKAEAQKLIKQYKKLQEEARSADATEAARKAAEAEKLVSQISSLQAAISKLQAKDREKETVTKKPITVALAGKRPVVPGAASTGVLTEEEIKRAEEEKNLLESRIGRIEKAQKKTREQIEQLSRAKQELARLRNEAEQSVAKERRANDEKLQQELAKLIQKKEAEQQSLKQELELIRHQAQKDAELLKVQRDAARALMEKQKQLERENLIASRSRRATKGLWIGLIAGAVSIVVLIILVLVTPWFDSISVVRNLKPKPSSTPESIASPKPTTPKPLEPTAVVKVEEKVEPLKSLAMYRDKLTGGGQGPLMVKLPGGTFKMGVPDSMSYTDERPQHEVRLESFSIGKYEVTFEEYDRFAAATNHPSLPDDKGWGRGNNPVINVSWDEASEYTKWLTEQTGHQYRLPSEREWEYAARAGTDTDYWWGYEIGKNNANCGVCGSQWDAQRTAPVGSFPSNSAGLHDVIGNVEEWTSSCFRPSYTGAPASGNWEGGECSKKMARSSSYRSYEKSLRVTKRNNYSPQTRMDRLGFRVVRVD